MVKDKSEMIGELMHKPAIIRNIGIAAHIDHGKCVSGDSKVHLASGAVVAAKDIFDEYSKEGRTVKIEDNETVFDIFDKNLYVNTFDKKLCTMLKRQITHIWKIRKTEPLVKIKLKNGLSIKTTPEHKFILMNGVEIIEKRADNLTLQDMLLCPRKEVENNASIEVIKIHIIKKLANDPRFYAFISEEMKSVLQQKIKHYGITKIWKSINSQWDYRSFGFSIRLGRYRLTNLVALAEMFGIKLDELYDSITRINFRGVKSKGVHSSVPMKLPKTDEEFNDVFYLIGLMFGDGNTEGNLDNADEQIQNEAIRIASSILGLNPKLHIYKDKCPRVYIGADTFRFFLNKIFDFPLVKKSLNIYVPQCVYIAPMKFSRSFISGYFDTDGTVETGRSAASICSASPAMLKSLQLLFLRFGIPSQYYEKKSSLYISGKKSLELFRGLIGFRLIGKQKRLDALETKAQKARNIGFISTNVIASGGLLQLSNLLGETYLCQIAEISRTDSEDYVYDFSVEDTHNFLAEGMIIHNTTLTDSIVAGAGMISEELAGKQLFTDFDKQEQERGITIFAANVSMVHELDGENYLINLIDTPGHVDFGGDVTRAMRAVDGAIILADAVEGVMPQTETVIRQALHERVKPVLFINKVDRLIKELKLTPEQMQERFIEIITNVNMLIQKYGEKKYADKWLVKVDDGSVAFGSGYRKWAISVPHMKQHGISFKNIIELTQAEKSDELSKIAPLHNILLNMVIKHLPSPADAQKYRIEKIWKGDVNSEIGKSMTELNENGPLAMIITKVVPDPHAGIIAAGRIFSGKIKRGQEVRLVGQHAIRRVQQVSVYRGAQRVQMEEVVAGNIIGVAGLTDAFSGETVCDSEREIDPFEAIKHMFEPVVTKGVECKDPKELTKLIAFLKQVSREDPTLAVKIDEETGQYLVSGLGELHLDAKVERPLKEKGIDVTLSPPIVIYRETVRSESPEVEGKSANKHNKFYVTIEPMEQGVYDALANGTLEIKNLRKEYKEVVQKLVDLGMGRDEAKKVQEIYERNMFIDATKGIQYLNETMELLIEGFKNAMNAGPLCGEPCSALKIRLVDAKLHEDAIHRGPAQVLPAINDAIKEAVFRAKPTLLEPIQVIRMDMPEEVMGPVMSLVQNKRGQVLDVKTELGTAKIQAKMPVSEMFGFESQLKSNTEGKGFYSLVDIVFEKLPEELKVQTIARIRERKGMTKDLPEF